MHLSPMLVCTTGPSIAVLVDNMLSLPGSPESFTSNLCRRDGLFNPGRVLVFILQFLSLRRRHFSEAAVIHLDPMSLRIVLLVNYGLYVMSNFVGVMVAVDFSGDAVVDFVAYSLVDYGCTCIKGLYQCPGLS